MKTLPNFRELKKVIMIDVREGDGTDESVSRIVHYIYTEDGEYVGKIDSCLPKP